MIRRRAPLRVLVLCVPALACGEEAGPGNADLDVLDPSLRMPVESVPPDRNAETAWALLGKDIRDFSDEEEELLEEIEKGGPVLGPKRREGLRRILDSKAPFLEPFHRGAAMDAYVPRVPAPGEDLNFIWRVALMGAVRLECLRARLIADSGDFEAATRSVDRALRAVSLFERGLLIDFFIVRGARARVLSEIRALAAHPQAPVSFLSGLPAVLEAHPAARLAEAIRFDFRAYALPLLLAVPATPDHPGWPAALGQHFSAIDDGDAAATVFIVGHLLDGHPKAFDRRATLALLNAIVLRSIDRVERPPGEADHGLRIPEDVESGHDSWPEELRGTLASKFEGSARDLALARARLREIENPLGKLVVYRYVRPEFALFDWKNLRDDWLEIAADGEATRVALAIRIHEARGGEAPAALDDLVAARILERLPLDPFSGKPLGWSRERRILWSVGSDLEDNGGARDRSADADEDEDEDEDENEDDDDEAAGPVDIVFDVPPVSKDEKPAGDRR